MPLTVFLVAPLPPPPDRIATWTEGLLRLRLQTNGFTLRGTIWQGHEVTVVPVRRAGPILHRKAAGLRHCESRLLTIERNVGQ